MKYNLFGRAQCNYNNKGDKVMAQVSYGTITVTDITDIENLYFEYCLVKDNVTVEDLSDSDYFVNLYVASEDTEFLSDKQYYVRIENIDASIIYYIASPVDNSTTYYERSNNTYTALSAGFVPDFGKMYFIKISDEESTEDSYSPIFFIVGQPDNGFYEREDPNVREWSTTYPVWIPGYNIWTREVKRFTETQELQYGTPFLDTAVNSLSADSNRYAFILDEVTTKLNHWWQNFDPTTESDYPMGMYMASGLEDEGIKFNENDSETYGFNSLFRQDGIYLRYNNIPLTELTKDSINLNYPTDSGEASPGVVLDRSGLQFYVLGNDNPIIQLTTTDGLTISNGDFITEGMDKDSAKPGNVTLSNHTFEREIGGINRENLRFAIGSNFGVSEDGEVYVGNAIHVGNTNTITSDYVNTQINGLRTEIGNNYTPKNKTITRIQPIYIIPVELDINNIQLPQEWVGKTEIEEDTWIIARPQYNSTQLIYTTFQVQYSDGEVITSSSLQTDIGKFDSIFDNNQIKTDLLNIDTKDISGWDESSLPKELKSYLNNLGYLPSNYSNIEKWDTLTDVIEIGTENTPYIRIASVTSDGISQDTYLNLQGNQINFVIGGQSGNLIIRQDGLIARDINVQTVKMRNVANDKTFGWITRANGHLSLKILKADEL